MKTNLEVKICGIKMKNPIMVASGTFGYGKEMSEFFDLDVLGAVVVKTVTLKQREGNQQPRIVETPSGMLNSIGLENKGVDNFINEQLPFYNNYKVPLIVNIAGNTIDEYVELAKKLNNFKRIDALELNVSCPNVKKGGIQIGIDPKSLSDLIRKVKKTARIPVIVKLTPNVTNIVDIALCAQKAGADALSLINTIRGMAVDIDLKKPKLSTISGGLSGPAIKPVALYHVYETAKAVKIPVIGIGGIMNYKDALEFLMAGANAVQVGTANFIDPLTAVKIIKDIQKYIKDNNIFSINSIIKSVKA